MSTQTILIVYMREKETKTFLIVMCLNE